MILKNYKSNGTEKIGFVSPIPVRKCFDRFIFLPLENWIGNRIQIIEIIIIVKQGHAISIKWNCFGKRYQRVNKISFSFKYISLQHIVVELRFCRDLNDLEDSS